MSNIANAANDFVLGGEGGQAAKEMLGKVEERRARLRDQLEQEREEIPTELLDRVASLGVGRLEGVQANFQSQMEAVARRTNGLGPEGDANLEMGHLPVSSGGDGRSDVEAFVWGRAADEDHFLRLVVADGAQQDVDKMLAQVQNMQRELNGRLRQGVEENYPRLLELVGGIDQLDSAHAQFQHEMDAVTRRADKLASQSQAQVDRVRANVLAIDNLTKLGRLLGDAIKCEELAAGWREQSDLGRRAEMLAELNGIVRANDKLKHLRWLQDRCLFKQGEMLVRTRQELLDQLRQALRSLNAAVVSANVKALQQLLDGPTGCQKELGQLADEAVRELDALFMQLGAQSSQEKAARLLPQLGAKLHSQLEQFQLLGGDNVHQFARQVGRVISTRVPPNAPFAMRLVQTVYKCVATHTDPVANVIREALNPLKASILSQSLAALFALVDDTFRQEERRDAIVVEKLNAALRAELASVDWDPGLAAEMEGNVQKGIQYAGLRLEQQLSFTEQTLRFVGRVSRAQTQNYQLLNIAHELARHWPGAGDSLRQSVIRPAVQTILEQMRATVSLVLASMHDEDMLSPVPAGQSSSEYVKELCAHLKVFRQHCAQLRPLADSVDALPSFLNFCIEQFLLHISLIRPISGDSVDRFVRDLDYLCRNGLQAFNCKYAKLLNTYSQIQQFIKSFPDKLSTGEIAELFHSIPAEGQQQPAGKASSANPLPVPQWFIAQMLICASADELRLPHDSAGWSIPDYVRWFNQHSELERWRFLRSLLDAYKQSVVAKGGTQFVSTYPLLNQLVNSSLSGVPA